MPSTSTFRYETEAMENPFGLSPRFATRGIGSVAVCEVVSVMVFMFHPLKGIPRAKSALVRFFSTADERTNLATFGGGSSVDFRRKSNRGQAVTNTGPGLFLRSRSLRALPEFFSGWAEFSFSRDDADRKWLRLRSEVQERYSVSETVTKVYRNGDANALAKQFLKPHIAQRTSLWGTRYQSDLKSAIA